MTRKNSAYTREEHIRARQMFSIDERAATLKRPPGIMAGYANGRVFGLSETATRYEHYLPDARRALRRGL